MIVPTQGHAVNWFCTPSSAFAALFPISDCPIQIHTIDPDSPQTGRPNGRQIARRNQVAQGPGADAAVELRGLEIEQPSGCPTLSPAAYRAFRTCWGLRPIDELADGRRHRFLTQRIR